MGRSFTWFPTEGGGCLTSKFAEELYKALQTNNLVTAAYHSQMNGLVERFNHTFAEMLSMNFSSCHDDWDEIVDFMVFSYNTSRQESTGVTPFYSLYGRKATLPMDVALGNNPNFADGKKPRSLATRLAEIREKVKRRLIVVQAKQKERYDRLWCTVFYTLVIKCRYFDRYERKLPPKTFSPIFWNVVNPIRR